MIERQRLFALVCVGFVAVVMTSVSLWGLWVARSRKGMCDGLKRPDCDATRHCYFVEKESDGWGGDKVVNSCRRQEDIDTLSGFGIALSVCLWLTFFVSWTIYTPVAARRRRLYSAGMCLVVLMLVFAVYLLVMWVVLESTAALVFSIIFGTIFGAVALGDLALRVADWLESRQPPNYEELGEVDKH